MATGKRSRAEFEGRRTSSPAKLPHLKRNKSSFSATSPHSSSSISSQPSVSEASALAPTDDGVSVASFPKSFPTSPLSAPDTRHSYMDDTSDDEEVDGDTYEAADWESEMDDDDSNDASSIIVSFGATKNHKPAIQAIPENAESMGLMDRLAAFLPQIKAANDELHASHIKGDADDHNMEIVNDVEHQYIEMDLGLGILEHRRATSALGIYSTTAEESEDDMIDDDIHQPGVMEHLLGVPQDSRCAGIHEL